MSLGPDQLNELLARAEAAAYKVKLLAADRGIGIRQLQRAFREEIGKSPKKAFNEFRLQRALADLKAGKSVKEAAADAQYTSSQQFSKAFKKYHGKPPSSVCAKCLLSALTAKIAGHSAMNQPKV